MLSPSFRLKDSNVPNIRFLGLFFLDFIMPNLYHLLQNSTIKHSLFCLICFCGGSGIFRALFVVIGAIECCELVTQKRNFI